MTVFEAYITNLGKYAEGQLVGETLKFPATTEEVQSLLKNIGVDGVRYATINKQDAGFLAPKLPGNIEFNTSDLDVKLQAGDEISGCYLSGTINGSSVRVVDVTIKGNASQGINDLISLNEVSDYITEKGYTSKDFEESLMGRFREDIIRSWGASDLLFSGINADGWYLDDDKNRGISLTYDGDGYVCEVVIWSGEKETGVDR